MTESHDERLQWDLLDPLILSGSKIEFLMRAREATGVGIPEALEILRSRYDVLRRTRPEAFHCSDEDYWKGFYS